MKTFVYLKAGSEKVAEYDNVDGVMEDRKTGRIIIAIRTKQGLDTETYPMKKYKTTTYQN